MWSHTRRSGQPPAPGHPPWPSVPDAGTAGRSAGTCHPGWGHKQRARAPPSAAAAPPCVPYRGRYNLRDGWPPAPPSCALRPGSPGMAYTPSPGLPDDPVPIERPSWPRSCCPPRRPGSCPPGADSPSGLPVSFSRIRRPRPGNSPPDSEPAASGEPPVRRNRTVSLDSLMPYRSSFLLTPSCARHTRPGTAAYCCGRPPRLPRRTRPDTRSCARPRRTAGWPSRR